MSGKQASRTIDPMPDNAAAPSNQDDSARPPAAAPGEAAVRAEPPEAAPADSLFAAAANAEPGTPAETAAAPTATPAQDLSQPVPVTTPDTPATPVEPALLEAGDHAATPPEAASTPIIEPVAAAAASVGAAAGAAVVAGAGDGTAHVTNEAAQTAATNEPKPTARNAARPPLPASVSSTGRRAHWLRLPRVITQFSNPAESAQRALFIGRFVLAAITVLMLALVGRVYQLQTQPPERIAQRIDSQHSSVSLLARRGSIEDRVGRPLAITREVYSLFVDPQMIEDRGTFAERVGYGVGIDPAMIEQRISSRADRRFVPIDRHLSDDRHAKLKELLSHGKVPGLGTQARLIREYPQGSLAGQVIGFAGFDGHGVDGLEKSLDKQLLGRDGAVGYLRDAGRRPLWIERDTYSPPTDGRSLRLSLDLTIQSFAETELTAACKKYAAESGELVVMDPRTGEVLAIANYPTIDPASFGTTKPELRRNRPVTDTFEPGSTFKPFIWAAATEMGAARPSEMIDCHNGFYVTPAGRKLHDAHGHGMLSWEEVLSNSSNIGMAIVGQRLGAEKLHDACRKFGFGKPSGSGLPGEITGKLRPAARWTSYSVTSVPMGQEISVTPLQMTRAFCAFANDGFLVTPTVLLREANEPVIRERILSSGTVMTTRAALRKVVTEGTGRKANSDMYEIFGKTGTAQIADAKHGGYLPNAYVAGFICGAPYDAPRVVVSCFIHRPDRSIGHFGGTVSAPAAKNVVEQTLTYLGVPPIPVDPSTLPAAKPKLVRR